MEIVMKRILMLSGLLGCMIIGRAFGAARSGFQEPWMQGMREQICDERGSINFDRLVTYIDGTYEPQSHMSSHEVANCFNMVSAIKMAISRELNDDDKVRLNAKIDDMYIKCDAAMGPLHDKQRKIQFTSLCTGFATGLCISLLSMGVLPFKNYLKEYDLYKDYVNKCSVVSMVIDAVVGTGFFTLASITGLLFLEVNDISRGLEWRREFNYTTRQEHMTVRRPISAIYDTVPHFVVGTCMGGVTGSTTALAGLLAYAGYKSIVD
jgi:hypothetical protein